MTLVKNTLVLLLLACLAAYHFGYQAVYFSLHLRVEKDWSDRIYSGKTTYLQEEVLQIPLTVAYMPDQDYFQEVNATFEKDGRIYRMIKQRYHNDTLQIVYVPDSGKQDLKKLISVWATSQGVEDSSSQGISMTRPAFKPYIQEITPFHLPRFNSTAQNRKPAYRPHPFASVYRTRTSPPPEMLG